MDSVGEGAPAIDFCALAFGVSPGLNGLATALGVFTEETEADGAAGGFFAGALPEGFALGFGAAAEALPAVGAARPAAASASTANERTEAPRRNDIDRPAFARVGVWVKKAAGVGGYLFSAPG